MRIALLNMTQVGSTGKIMLQIADLVRREGYEAKTYSPVIYSRHSKTLSPSLPDHYTWGTRLESAVHYYLGSFLGQNGRLSRRGTKQLLKDLDAFRPDIIHLNNLHSFCINLPMLFRYIKKHKIKVIWTLHDCWSFTGHCPHFVMEKCEKWKTGCHHCPRHRSYPKSYVDDSRWMYRLKKKWFTGVKDLTLVTPSNWLAQLTRESFLKDYPVKVISNGIDLSVFSPMESDFRKKYACEDKKIVLGVSFGWDKKKGLDVFIELAKRLDKNYQIVLVGTNATLDAQLPPNIISIHRTDSQKALAEIYTAADVFINPTREDTFPTVNIEALACGTPVITFATGGSPEVLDETCGIVVAKDDICELQKRILQVCETTAFSAISCVNRAKCFNMNEKFYEYIALYKEIL